MAQTIKIKRSTTAAAPSSALGAGELAYSFYNNTDKLFIGNGSSNDVIGGKVYVDMLDHTAGTLTASSAIITDSNSKINQLKVDNLVIDGNTISTGSGALIIDPSTAEIDFATGGAIEFNILDNSATALTISEGSNVFMTFDTTNSAEKIIVGKPVDLDGKELIFDADADTSISSSIDDLLVFKSAGTNWLLASGNVGLTPTGSSAPLGSSGTPWSVLFVDNIKVDGNAITSENTNGDITITPNGTGSVVLDGISYPQSDGSAGQFLKTDGSGNLSFGTVSSTITLAADSGSNDTYTTGQTLTFTGGEGIDTTVGDNTITIAGELATTSNKGIASFASADFSVSSGVVTIASGAVSNSQLANSSVTIGSDSLSLGGTITDINGLTSLDVDNLTLNGNEISSTNTNGNISLNPNGTGVVDVNNSRISNVTDPTQAQDAATKAYVDAVKQALDIKESVRVATTANITIATDLNVGDTIDGVTLADGDRVLVKNQSTGSQNGIYVAGSSPVRSADANTSSEVTSGLFVFVEEGTANADQGYVLTTNDAITLDSTALTFTQFSGAGAVEAGSGLSRSGTTLSANVDNKTLQISSDNLRLKGITATATGDIIVGANGANGGYTALSKPSGNATAHDYILSMNTSGSAQWSNIIDGGTF